MRTPKLQALDTVADIVDELGGPVAVGAMCGVSRNTVYHWIERGIPPQYYLIMTEALRKQGFTAPAALWQMVEVAAQ
jgi:hypothetical protein